MAIREVRASGLEALNLATELLQRARIADPEAGLWEAADLQWWWRMPRRSDAIDQRFWLDEAGRPLAAIILSDWGDAWACDPIVVAGAEVTLETLLGGAIAAIDALALDVVDVVARDDDPQLGDLLLDAGFVPTDDRYGITWMDAPDRPELRELPSGFSLVDRASATGRSGRRSPHPMRRRNGELVETRLRQCSLYDPALDLAVVTDAGDTAGYALFWFDPVTHVGLVEPMRVEEPYQRRGLARALLAAGLDRLARRGARRLKVGYRTEPARGLYLGAGFRPAATGTAFRWTRSALPAG
jgi:GNAT superfamily N-acetyltransferase